MKKNILITILVVLAMLFNYSPLFGHCDTMDGPVAIDAKKAIDNNNINYILKWVMPNEEKEITEAYQLAMKVRGLSPEAKELAEKYFYETVIRLHRMGENMPYTGVKPAGTPIDEKIKAADESIAKGNLSPLDKLVPENKKSELKHKFEKVMTLKDFDINDVKAGREYVHAYVEFFHYAEGEQETHKHGH
jgi:hypothetical protein